MDDIVIDWDSKSHELCRRLESIGDGSIGGRALALELGLSGERQLRRLVAHARTRLHRHEIVGIPGIGYFWGPAAGATRTRQCVDLCRRMGRCWFYISALLSREGAATALAQMVFDFMQQAPAGSQGDHDELAALMASHGVTTGDFLDRFLREMATTPEGLATLQQVGSRHASVLVPQTAFDNALTALDAARTALLQAQGRVA